MTPPRMRFFTKLLLLLLGIVLLLQAVTYVAARAALLDSTVGATRNTLKIGVDVFAYSMQSRSDQLKNSVAILVNDFGFRQAVATRDAPTIVSALQNQASRIHADRAMAIDADGQWLADTGAGSGAASIFNELFADADHGGSAAANLVVDGVPYIFVVSSVRAPVRIGWVAMGFKLDNAQAESIKRLTLLDVSFFVGSEIAPRYVSGTLNNRDAEQLRAAVIHHLPAEPTQLMQGDRTVMTAVVPLTRGGEALFAVLQLPMQQALQPYYRLSQQLLWIALAGLLLAVGIAYFMGYRLTHSVRWLATATARIATGDYSQPVTIKTNDEIGDLADTLNAMQRAIIEREQRIVHQAEHDQLTGLPNRAVANRALIAAIENAQAGAARDGRNRSLVAVVVIDINHFKAINDTFGHDVGDQVLRHVAERTLSSVKLCDTVVRLGNDEFLVVLVGVDKPQAIKIAQRLLRNLAAPLQLGELKFTIDAHAGIAAYPDDGDAAEVLIRRADIAMTLCKQDSKLLGARYASYQNGWEELRLRRLALVRDLSEAIDGDGLRLKFQPKLSFITPTYVGAEALIRWQHPQLGFIAPDEFIPLAESSGHIIALTRWVIDAAVAQIAKWARDNLSVNVSINISALDLLDASLPNYIYTTLKLHNVHAERLCLELTESSVMVDLPRSMESLQRFRDMGLRLSVDDFGTGYSSLAQLKKLPIDELKIDKSFVLKLDESSDDQVIVRSTIELGHNMGLEVVAEGMETSAARELLRGFGCDMMQGYLVAQPLTADEFMNWASAQNLLQRNFH